MKRKTIPSSKDNDFVYDSAKPAAHDSSSEKPHKKVKMDEQKLQQVTQGIRELKKNTLLEMLKRNPTFMAKGERILETKVKEIENQEFGDNHQNK